MLKIFVYFIMTEQKHLWQYVETLMVATSKYADKIIPSFADFMEKYISDDDLPTQYLDNRIVTGWAWYPSVKRLIENRLTMGKAKYFEFTVSNPSTFN